MGKLAVDSSLPGLLIRLSYRGMCLLCPNNEQIVSIILSLGGVATITVVAALKSADDHKSMVNKTITQTIVDAGAATTTSILGVTWTLIYTIGSAIYYVIWDKVLPPTKMVRQSFKTNIHFRNLIRRLFREKIKV